MCRLLTIVLVALLAGVAAGDEILLNTGREVVGEIQKVDETGITIKTSENVVTLPPEDLDTHAYYTAWAKRVPKDAKAHLRIAVFAYESGLFNQARKHYGRAKRLDKGAVALFERDVIPRIKEGVANRLLAQAKRALERKDMKAVKHFATKILTDLEDTQAAEKARAHIASLHVWQLSEDEKRALTVVARYLPNDEKKALAARKKIAARVEPTQDALRKAQDKAASALRARGKNRMIISAQAGDRFKKVLKDLDKITEGAGEDEALKAHLALMRSIARRDGVAAYVSAGELYVAKWKLKDAEKMARAAVGINPRSKEARAFHTDVQVAREARKSGWFGAGGW